MPNFGDDTSGPGEFPSSGDRAIVTQFTTSEAGTITGAFCYFGTSGSAGTSAKFIVHNDSSDVPGTLLVASGAVAIPAGGGWIDFGSLSGSLTASTKYHLGVVCNSFNAKIGEDESVTAITTMANGNYSYASPPSWPSPDTDYTTVRVNAYVVYTTGSGARLQTHILGSPIYKHFLGR